MDSRPARAARHSSRANSSGRHVLIRAVAILVLAFGVLSIGAGVRFGLIEHRAATLAESSTKAAIAGPELASEVVGSEGDATPTILRAPPTVFGGLALFAGLLLLAYSASRRSRVDASSASPSEVDRQLEQDGPFGETD